MTDIDCKSDSPLTLSFINTGGISKGLELYITGDIMAGNSLAFEPLYLHAREYEKKENRLLTFQAEQKMVRLKDGEVAYFYDFPDFKFPEGINQYSAALGFKMECIFRRSVHLWTKPVGDEHALKTMSLCFLPKTNRSGGLEWHRPRPRTGVWGRHGFFLGF